MGAHIERTRVRVHGPEGPEPISSWDTRIGRIVFDGRPLAEHVLSAEKEPVKRINEMLGAAYALVGAHVDREVRDLRSLPTRQGRNTADFEATLVGGSIVRIETCGLTNELEQLYINALSAIGHRAGIELAKHPDVMEKSPYFVRFYKRVLGPRDIKAVSEELAALLIREGPCASKTTSMSRVGPQYPLLHELEANWTRLDDRHRRTGVILDPLLHLLGSTRPRDAFPILFAEKAGKYDEYSDGGTVPVWLAMYVRASLTIPYGDVEALIDQSPAPTPFDRLIIGTKTIGKAFQRDTR